MSIGMFGAIMFVPFFMQGIVGVSAAESGTIMTPMMITMIVMSIIGGQLVLKVGVKPQIIAGMLIMAGGFWLLTTMDMHTTKLSYFLYDGYRFRNGSCNADINISVTRKLPEKTWCRNVIKSVLPSNWWNIWYYNFRINYE